jgi:hypothetical protein
VTNDGVCELLSSKFDPALCIAALDGRKHLSARHFVRFALERAIVHDEQEAERLALALGLTRHASGKRSLVDVGALCDLLFAVKSVAFSNAPPYARKFRLRPGEFVIKSSSVRVAVPDDGSSRRAFAILSNSRLWVADESERGHEIDVDTLLLAEASLGRLDRVGEPMPQLVVYTLRSAAPSLVIGFFAKAEVLPWCAALNELVVASRLQDELNDPELSHKAAHRLVLIEGLHRMPRPSQASRLLFFQHFHSSRAGAIGNALHTVRMLNCTRGGRAGGVERPAAGVAIVGVAAGAVDQSAALGDRTAARQRDARRQRRRLCAPLAAGRFQGVPGADRVAADGESRPAERVGGDGVLCQRRQRALHSRVPDRRRAAGRDWRQCGAPLRVLRHWRACRSRPT